MYIYKCSSHVWTQFPWLWANPKNEKVLACSTGIVSISLKAFIILYKTTVTASEIIKRFPRFVLMVSVTYWKDVCETECIILYFEKFPSFQDYFHESSRKSGGLWIAKRFFHYTTYHSGVILQKQGNKGCCLHRFLGRWPIPWIQKGDTNNLTKLHIP